jgi:cellobiose-specific phosphotransferase system component IIC
MYYSSLLAAFGIGRYLAKGWLTAAIGGLVGVLGTFAVFSMIMMPATAVDQVGEIGRTLAGMVETQGILALGEPILAVAASLFGFSLKQRRQRTSARVGSA